MPMCICFFLSVFQFLFAACPPSSLRHIHHHCDSFLTPGARSEALASLLLELHGLQDMLEGLWEWVAGAEATMAATEASPVGNDMETVETQLAQHEVCIKFSLGCLKA